MQLPGRDLFAFKQFVIAVHPIQRASNVSHQWYVCVQWQETPKGSEFRSRAGSLAPRGDQIDFTLTNRIKTAEVQIDLMRKWAEGYSCWNNSEKTIK